MKEFSSVKEIPSEGGPQGHLLVKLSGIKGLSVFFLKCNFDDTSQDAPRNPNEM